jgi:hypothetical protein
MDSLKASYIKMEQHLHTCTIINVIECNVCTGVDVGKRGARGWQPQGCYKVGSYKSTNTDAAAGTNAQILTLIGNLAGGMTRHKRETGIKVLSLLVQKYKY